MSSSNGFLQLKFFDAKSKSRNKAAFQVIKAADLEFTLSANKHLNLSKRPQKKDIEEILKILFKTKGLNTLALRPGVLGKKSFLAFQPTSQSEIIWTESSASQFKSEEQIWSAFSQQYGVNGFAYLGDDNQLEVALFNSEKQKVKQNAQALVFNRISENSHNSAGSRVLSILEIQSNRSKGVYKAKQLIGAPSVFNAKSLFPIHYSNP